MGANENYESQLYFCRDDRPGVYEKLTFSHATLDADIEETLAKDDNPLFMNLCHQLIQRVLLPIVGEFQIDPIDIPCRKIGKKKFRKWLMSEGISRNDAEFLCQLIGQYKGRISYGNIHRYFRWDPLLLGGLNYAAIIHEILFGKLLK